MKHPRNLDGFCHLTKGNKPPDFGAFRNIGDVDITMSTFKFSSGCITITDIARKTALRAFRTGFAKAFKYAVLAGILSHARIFQRLEAASEYITSIAGTDVITSDDMSDMAHLQIEHPLNGYLTLDSLTENAWLTFEKLLFLPVFLLVYFLNNEVAQWRKVRAISMPSA
jgi:hypothetical protein